MQRSFLRVYSLFWDLRLGVHTHGRFAFGGGHAENFKYSTLSYKQIFVILNNLKVGANDVFYDLGCGKGRVLCAVQAFKPQKIMGVEINRELAEIAKKNIEGMRGRKSPFEILNCSAAECDYRDGTVFYMYNPFGQGILERVLLQIRDSLSANPRKIKIVYVQANFNESLEGCDWLQRRDTWNRHTKYPFIPFATFWESKTS